MEIFGAEYSKYYDLMYKDKNYSAEAAYIDRYVQTYRRGAQELLELGTGTGKHAAALADLGYTVLGVERSAEMLALAKQTENGAKLSFMRGDIRSFSVERRFDSAHALFHVVNYMSSNEDLLNLLRNVSLHLHKGGLFIFDSWYGPAVLTQQPEVRVRRWEDEETRVIRIAEPDLLVDSNVVDVHYHILTCGKKGDLKEWQETHRMRYLFTPEVELLMDQTGLKLEHVSEFLTGKQPGTETWNVLYVGRKR